jgi:hypothetical protein
VGNIRKVGGRHDIIQAPNQLQQQDEEEGDISIRTSGGAEVYFPLTLNLE